MSERSPILLLEKYWHHRSFRPLQQEVIEQVLDKKDTLVVLPTGGGKSICYQVPALLMDGTCLVISPLIALMKDQAYGLESKGIPALIVHSGMKPDELRNTYEKMSSGRYKFIFVSPERLKSVLFLDFLTDWNIDLIAVDEAHCISQWGYDFRPAYLDIALLRTYLPKAPVIALTASATPRVQDDISDKLKLEEPAVFFSTFVRPSLSFSVLKVENKLLKTVDILQKVKGSALVYCRNRKRTREIAELLNANGMNADYYHAGLDPEVRSEKQDNWLHEKKPVMVCTNAFGMGIDKADVRCVIHYDIPDTPEAYYQEAGRAGRDGQKAYAVLLYQPMDLNDLKNGIDLKYPPEETMKAIYESVAYYLQVAVHQGLDTVYDFEVTDFVKKFGFNILEVISSIKLFEQQGYWTLSDGVFVPSKIRVCAGKREVEELEQWHPELHEILKQVLRMYGGIWQNVVPVYELQIAQQASVSKDYVQMILRRLHALGIIQYIAATDKPQLTYLHNRLPKNQLNVDAALLNELKTSYTERVEFMIHYASQQQGCRMQQLVGYFKEQLNSQCGICDLCLLQKQNLHPKDYFEQIKNNIEHEIALYGALNIDLFCRGYSTIMHDRVMTVIRFLLDEQELILDAKGQLIKGK